MEKRDIWPFTRPKIQKRVCRSCRRARPRGYKHSDYDLLIATEADHKLCVQALVDNKCNLEVERHEYMPFKIQNRDITALGIAVKMGNLKIVKVLIKAGAKRNFLHIAYGYNYMDIMQVLLDSGADTEINDRIHGTVLERAVKDHNIEAINMLISAGAKTTQETNEAMTALGIKVMIRKERDDNVLLKAVIDGNMEAIKMLIKAGTRVNQETSRTALGVAVKMGNLEIVKVLVQAGANCNQITLQSTPLELAYENNNLEIFQILLDSGADTERRKEGHDTVLQKAVRDGNIEGVNMLIKAQAKVNEETNDGMTALGIAAEMGYLEIVKILIQAAANLNHHTKKTQKNIFRVRAYGNPLQLAYENDHLDILKVLLESGADTEIRKDVNDYTVLLKAARDGNITALNMLIKFGAKINQTTHKGNTVLHLVASSWQLEVLETLVTAGANINKFNDGGVTPLILAAQKGYLNTVQKLISLGADINQTTLTGRFPLKAAVISEDVRVLEYLLQNGACVNASTNDNWTALFLATFRNNKQMIEVLLHYGADVRILDNEKYSALDHAMKSDTPDCTCINLLHAAGATLSNGQIARSSIFFHRSGDVKKILETILNNEGLLSLTSLCRKVIRAHLMEIAARMCRRAPSTFVASRKGQDQEKERPTSFRHNNLFQAVPGLPLPKKLKSFLMFDVQESGQS